MSTEVLEAFVGEMTVSEFCRRTGHSVSELLALSAGSQHPKRAPTVTEARPKRAPTATKARPKRVNSLDLVSLDERVMTLLTRNREGVGGRELADATGTPLPQLRGSLKRLIAAKRVRFAGKTKARLYWAT